MAEQAAEQISVRQAVNKGLRWSVLNTIVSRLGSLLTGILLARILAPEDYGVFAVALVTLTALVSMNELGVSLAVVKWENNVERIAPTVATLAISASTALYVFAFIAAPVVARALNAPEATAMIRVLSVCVLLDALASVPAAFISRYFLQRRRFAIDFASFCVGTGLSIVLALLGFGAWAMIWGFLVSNIVAGVLAILLAPVTLKFGFDVQISRELLHFGLPLAGSSLILFAMLNLDYLVVGSILGPTALGLYLLAFNMCSWPVNLVSATIRRVTLSGFSRISVHGEVQSTFVTATAAVLFAALPMCTGLILFAEPIIMTLYGPAWHDSVPVLRFLAVLALTRILVELVYDYLVAAGANLSNLALQIIWMIALLPALIIGAHVRGIVGVAAGHAVVALIVVVPAVAWFLRRSDVSLRALAKAAAWPLLCTALMVVVGLICMKVLSDAQGWALLMAGGSLSALAYAGLAWPRLNALRSTSAVAP